MRSASLSHPPGRSRHTSPIVCPSSCYPWSRWQTRGLRGAQAEGRSPGGSLPTQPGGKQALPENSASSFLWQARSGTSRSLQARRGETDRETGFRAWSVKDLWVLLCQRCLVVSTMAAPLTARPTSPGQTQGLTDRLPHQVSRCGARSPRNPEQPCYF